MSHHVDDSLFRAAEKRLIKAIATIEDDLCWYWHKGDGHGGFVLDLLAQAVRRTGNTWPLDRKASSGRPKKKKIGRRLSKQVFERDRYRCVVCDSHVDLCCDHIIAESVGGETTLGNLQTMCRPCNTRKGAK